MTFEQWWARNRRKLLVKGTSPAEVEKARRYAHIGWMAMAGNVGRYIDTEWPADRWPGNTPLEDVRVFVAP